LLFLFEDFTLDTDRRELRRSGTIIPIEPQVFDVLVYLIRCRDRVVTRDDLLAAVWEGRIVSESTLSSRINAARVALGDNGEDQRLIRTILRRGFRFVGDAQEVPSSPAVVSGQLPAVTEAGGALVAAPVPSDGELIVVDGNAGRVQGLQSSGPPSDQYAGRVSASPAPRRWLRIAALAGCAGLIAVAVAVALLWPRADVSKSAGVTGPAFDPMLVPLIRDAQRRSLVSYRDRPGAKALAIAFETMVVVDGAADLAAARDAALRQCQARTKRVCRIYAAGMNVVWTPETVPLPAASDLRTESLSLPIVTADIPLIRQATLKDIADLYARRPGHKALALTTGGFHVATERGSRAEAVRLALEGCGEEHQRPCLVLSVDNMLTLQIPKSRKLDRIFLPSLELEIPSADRERIGKIYQGPEWRAVATGKSGTWHAVAGEASEADAVAAALKACEQADQECKLYAIGNFHVTEQ
jgi:DNA-binding winged helix-turn-helix (wHTH) protein